MRTEPTDVAVADLLAMPEDVAAAWASVLVDVYEKRKEASLPHHGERFLRAALHLRHRAEAAGVCIGAALVCSNRQYRLSHANGYRAALGDEPVRLADARIRDVLASPPPQDFSRLWADDLAHRLSHHVSQKEKIACA